jgi:trypsin
MPKSTRMGLRWVLPPAAALVVAAACCAPAGAVVGGTKAVEADPPTGQLDYQVALIRNDRPSTSSGQFCGGSVRAEVGQSRHIVTAAHCVFDNSATAPGQPISPSNLDVLAGTPYLNSGGHRLHVEAVSIDPSYDPATLAHDAAVVTLVGASPLENTGAQPIDLVSAGQWQPPSPSATAVVSGWGRIASGTYPLDLRWAEMPFATDATCQTSWATEGADTSVMVCAGRPGIDSCSGDSGGPLAILIDNGFDPPFPALAGIVSYGDLACDGAPPGVYTRVASSAIRSYLNQANPISAPRNTSPPVVGGAIEVGQTITCAGGSWESGPALEYQFVRGLDERTTAALTNLGSQASYVVTSADVGSQLACIVKAHNGGGWALSQSAWTAAVPAPASPVPPVLPPNNQSPSQNQQDLAAPVARIKATRCTATRCTLTVAVTDAGFSAGIKTVLSTVHSTYRSRCRRNGRTVACTKHKTIKPRVAALTSTQFKIVASKLPYGTQRFTLVAVDKAGHRQALPTTKTVRTKKPRTRR